MKIGMVPSKELTLMMDVEAESENGSELVTGNSKEMF